MFNTKKLGALKAILSPHLESKEFQEEIDRYPTQTIIGLGQGGGRIAAELSRFGFPTYIVNSSKSDMDEHDTLIPDNNRILTRSSRYTELEGTDKNAALGFEIAKENKDVYGKLALNDSVKEADFVWVTVSLGGGTGNGALRVALMYLSKVRSTVKKLPDGKIPLGVICSLPSKDEKGSAFRQNALAGISILQDMMNKGEIGSVLVIDNEKMKDYYAREPLKTYGGTLIDAKSYGNMVVASLIAEVASIPILKGRSVYDKTEFLSTISTPGWLSISKLTTEEDENLEEVVKHLFNENEILASYSIEDVSAGGVAVMYPAAKNIAPKSADDVYRYASDILDTKVNLSITTNKEIKKMTLYGLAVLKTPSTRVMELKNEYEEWKKKEEEQERRKKEKADALGLDGFSDFIISGLDNLEERGTIEENPSDFKFDEIDELDDNWQKKSSNLSLEDLQKLDI